jgi:Outer membrane lipoprotein-sorting protein
MLKILVPLCISASFLGAAARAQSVDDIIANNIKARGGLEKIRALRSARASGKLTVGPFRVAFLQENKRPEKVREEVVIQGLAQVQSYDGSVAWQISPFGGRKDPERMSQDDAKSLMLDADIEGPLVNYKEKGHKAELVGHDSVEGTDCFKIKLTLKNGDVRYSFIDADSYMEIKTETQSVIRGAIQYTETYYGDYEQVEGVYYPFAIDTGEKGGQQRQKYELKKMEVNIPLEDSRFSMPAGKPESTAAPGSSNESRSQILFSP